MLHRASRIRGADVRAADRLIGRVDDFVFDDRGWIVTHLLVDTHPWLPGGTVTIETSAIRRNWGIAGLHLRLTSDQVRQNQPRDTAAATASHQVRTKDVKGDHLRATDGEVGHVDDFLIDESS